MMEAEEFIKFLSNPTYFYTSINVEETKANIEPSSLLM